MTQGGAVRIEHASWLAAAVDGEGSVILRNRGRGKARAPRFQAHVVIVNNHRGFLEFAQKVAKAGNIYEGAGRRKANWQLRIERRDDVLRVLEAIEPYLIIKKDKARAAMDTMLNQEPHIPFTLSVVRDGEGVISPVS